ncbi:formylmethanofuran dehydrogenase subunit E family protein [Solirhodobacter olei]|uniref:formylmethanofuran dehydrogenase subunit E family protein n=1 Tax=Solirhodobacter olei TaxID=2493082 RepID=UPI0019D4E42C|nr:formylmethanofuran dehydrogenase subunit E family protein [Solirhodobacter olei]
MAMVGFLVAVAGLEARPASAGDPTYRQGENIFIETGVEAPDRAPSWYAPMAGKPYAPVFEMLATRGTQGRYYPYTYPVTLKDMIRFHGHDCEGTIHAAASARVALDVLFPDGIIDRSVLWGISGPSPCWSDAVAFLTGARIQYGNLGYFKDARYGHAIILYREDTGVAVLATWKKGINNIPGEPVMLPGAVDWKPEVDSSVVMKLKSDVKAQGGTPTPYQVDLLRYLQWKHVNDILEHPLAQSYQVQVLQNFRWEDWIDPTRTIPASIARTDTRLKNYPYRPKPISGPEDAGQ